MPPIIDAPLRPPRAVDAGRLGMRLALVAPAIILLFLILRPG